MDRTAISDQIDRILRSQSFANKSQLRKLLEVLFKNIDSQTTLKPDRVIQELWPQETRTKGSADVATEMNRLRNALESYYKGEGTTDPIVVILPNRSVPGPDGMPEKRWIVANPREEATAGALRASEDQRLISQAAARRALTLAAAIAAIGIAGYFSFRVLMADERPRSGRLDASTLTIMNAEGKELWRKVYPDGLSTDWYYEKGILTRIWFGDLEGKGRTDVLFAVPAGRQPTVPLDDADLLLGSRQREMALDSWAESCRSSRGARRRTGLMALSVLKATEKGPPRIAVLSLHDPWWPSQIALLDSNGKTISEYWHSGGLGSMVLADLDGDGREEIIATGISNGYDHQATLMVLDPDRVFGASTEVRPEFQIHGMGVAQERLRLLFPRSDLNRALFQYNRATDPTVRAWQPSTYRWRNA